MLLFHLLVSETELELRMKYLVLFEQPKLAHVVDTVAAFKVAVLVTMLQKMLTQIRVIACLVGTRDAMIDFFLLAI